MARRYALFRQHICPAPGPQPGGRGFAPGAGRLIRPIRIDEGLPIKDVSSGTLFRRLSPLLGQPLREQAARTFRIGTAGPGSPAIQSGRAACRARLLPYVSILVIAGP